MSDYPKTPAVHPPQAAWRGLPGWPLQLLPLMVSRALTGYPSECESHAVFLSTRVAKLRGIEIPGLLAGP